MRKRLFTRCLATAIAALSGGLFLSSNVDARCSVYTSIDGNSGITNTAYDADNTCSRIGVSVYYLSLSGPRWTPYTVKSIPFYQHSSVSVKAPIGLPLNVRGCANLGCP